jgi:hypothetical protein
VIEVAPSQQTRGAGVVQYGAAILTDVARSTEHDAALDERETVDRLNDHGRLPRRVWL